MGSTDNHRKMHKDVSPPLESLIRDIDRQVDLVPHPHAAKGFENFWGTQVGEYKKPDQQFIRFELDGNVFAVPLQNAVEIDYLPDVTSLPNLPQWVLGICNLRGDIVSVVDIKQIMGMASSDAGALKKLILIRNEVVSTAIIVDRILGMLFADEHHLQSDFDLEVDESFSGFVQRTIVMNRRTVHLLDVNRLIKALELRT